MNTADVSQLCRNVEEATEVVRNTFKDHTNISGTVERFWCLQDTLARLVQAAHDRRNEAFTVMEREHQGLIRRVVHVLSSAEALQFASRSLAVKASMNAINGSLLALQNARQSIEPLTRSAAG